jgi:hypothetical protein
VSVFSTTRYSKNYRLALPASTFSFSCSSELLDATFFSASSVNSRSSSSGTWSLILNRMTGSAKRREPASKAQHEANMFMYGVFMLSRRHMMAAPADWIPLKNPAKFASLRLLLVREPMIL